VPVLAIYDGLIRRDDDGEVDLEVPGGRVAEVDATPVDALVLDPDVVDLQLGGMGGAAEVGTSAEGRGRGPQTRLSKLPPSHIEAVMKGI